MPGRPAESLQSKLDGWLVSLGFSRGNPFATAEADRERTLLPDFFVEVDSYEQIKSNRTMVIFAPKGGGKSALRLVLASKAAPLASEAVTLAVEYTDFDTLIARRRGGQHPTINDHITGLLRAGVKALFDTLCGAPPAVWSNTAPQSDRQRALARATAVPAPARSRLARLARTYHPNLLHPETLYRYLHTLDPTFTPEWEAFVAAAGTRHLRPLIRSGDLCANAIAYLLADLNDYPDMPIDSATTPVESIESFIQLAQMSGLMSVQFLIDRLDEYEETANDPHTQADILEPLLAHLPLMELPYGAFKFFLAEETHSALRQRLTIRDDRLMNHSVTVIWEQSRLKDLLDARLEVYSDQAVKEILQLCEDIIDIDSGREVGKRIEAEMLELAQGSPRHLLHAGQLLCQAHVRRIGPVGVIERGDWEAAKAELLPKTQPLLRLRKRSRVARVGDREITLTDLQHKILLTLAEAQDYCDKEILAEAAWDAKKGVSDETIRVAIARLREKLGDDVDDPLYLHGERGQRIKLTNYEIE